MAAPGEDGGAPLPLGTPSTTSCSSLTVRTTTPTTATRCGLQPRQNHWLQLSPGGTHPTARNGASLAWDTTDGVAFMFGGNTGAGYANDLSIYQPTVFPAAPVGTQPPLTIAAGRPSPRSAPSLPPARPDRCLGRRRSPDVRLRLRSCNDLWRYDLASNSWSQVLPASATRRPAS